MTALPVFKVVIDALNEILSNWKVLLNALVLPAVGISLVEAIPLLSPESVMLALLAWALSMPFYALFAIVCHRVIILGAVSLPNEAGIFWGERETRFFWLSIGLAIATYGLAALFGFVLMALPKTLLEIGPSWLPMAILFSIFFYFYIRISLVFPATAVDKHMEFSDAMDLSTGNGLRMMAAIAVSLFPLLVFSGLISLVVWELGSIAGHFVDELMAYLGMTIAICVVSVIYRTLIDLEPTEKVE